MDHIKRHFTDDDGNAKELDILTSGAPSVSGDDNYLDVFYSLIDATNKRLEAIDGPQDLVLAFGAEEVKLTLGSDKTIRFDNISQFALLQSEDFLSLRLYLNNDAGNLLWEFAFGSGLKVISSNDEGSREAKSFVMRAAEDPIKVEWLPALEVGDRVQWKIEALKGNSATDDLDTLTNDTNKKYMYGQIKDKKFQEDTVSGTGTGKYEDAWTSNAVTVTAELEKYKQISFKPDMSIEAHPAWGSGGAYKGTNKKDTWRRNPLVGYKVTFMLNGESKATATIKMDEIDGLRQEYLDLKRMTPTAGDHVNGIDLPPERSVFKLLAEMPSPVNVWADVSDPATAYPYKIILDDGMSSIYNQLTTAFETFKQNDYEGVGTETVQQVVNGQVVEVEQPIMVSIPTEITIRVSSGYRNPERQERQGGTTPASRSAHMSGKALDIALDGATGTATERRRKNAKAYYGMWVMVRNGNVADANWYQLEYGTASKIVQAQEGGAPVFGAKDGVIYDFVLDSNIDGVPDAVEDTEHFHLDARDI
ncbi:MAG: hypothetical protein K0Q78_1091 [Cellvibrio sp.]|nr:hypothetical protein [Cellvibrio sp.]